MTSVLRSMKMAMDACIGSFQEMQAATNTAMNTAAIEEGRSALMKASSAVTSIETNLKAAAAAQKRLNSDMNNIRLLA